MFSGGGPGLQLVCCCGFIPLEGVVPRALFAELDVLSSLSSLDWSSRSVFGGWIFGSLPSSVGGIMTFLLFCDARH